MSQDLSHAFGRPATVSLRGLLPHRDNGTWWAGPPTEADPSAGADPSTEVEPGTETGSATEADTSGALDEVASSSGPVRRRPPTTTSARSSANRRWGSARVASRDQVELLVLLALRPGATDGRGVIDRLREDSGGQLDAPERTVYVTLHRLARSGLVGRELDPGSGRRLYALTEAGERATRARLRGWRALARCVDAVARSGEPS